MTLSSRDAAKKRSLAYSHLRNCNLCPRECGVNRYETTGMCLIGEKVKVNVIAPHFGEGPSAALCPFAREYCIDRGRALADSGYQSLASRDITAVALYS